MEKTWTIYRIPNCIRIIDGVKVIGKVGITTNIDDRIYKNKKQLGLDTDGWYVLEVFKGTRSDAMKIEVKFQNKFNCLDGKQTKEWQQIAKDAGKKWGQKTGSINGKKSMSIIHKCPHCNVTMKGANYFRWHDTRCKKAPII